MRDTGYSESWYADRLARQAGMRQKPLNPNGLGGGGEAPSVKVDATQTIRKLDFQAPIRTVSEMNQREHWAVKNWRRTEQQKEMMVALQNNLVGRKVQLPCVVKLTRIGPKALDTDNLAGAMKHVQDAIARKLGVDDGDTEKVTWEYHQMPIRIREYAVKVSIQSV